MFEIDSCMEKNQYAQEHNIFDWYLPFVISTLSFPKQATTNHQKSSILLWSKLKLRLSKATQLTPKLTYKLFPYRNIKTDLIVGRQNWTFEAFYVFIPFQCFIDINKHVSDRNLFSFLSFLVLPVARMARLYVYALYNLISLGDSKNLHLESGLKNTVA